MRRRAFSAEAQQPDAARRRLLRLLKVVDEFRGTPSEEQIRALSQRFDETVFVVKVAFEAKPDRLKAQRRAKHSHRGWLPEEDRLIRARWKALSAREPALTMAEIDQQLARELSRLHFNRRRNVRRTPCATRTHRQRLPP